MRLALPRLLVRALVLGVAAIIWLLVASWLLDFGRGLSFDNLQALGQQTTGFLARINPYVWWGVVVIWTLIIFFIARGWLASDVAAARARPVPADELATLTGQLSDDSVAVLRWVWGSRDEPFTLGDLRQAHTELRHSRIDKLELVRRQGDILDGRAARPPAAAVPGTAVPGTSVPGTSVRGTSAPPSTPAEPRLASERVEPNL